MRRPDCIRRASILLAVVAVSCLIALAQQLSNSRAIADPVVGADLPALRILSMKKAAQSSDPQAMGANYDIALRNPSDRGILGYGIRYSFSTNDNESAGRTCFASYSFDPAKPMIGPQDTISLHPQLARRGARVTASVDVVLWADGTYHGPDSCGMLPKYAIELRSRRATQEIILDSLTRHGLEKTIMTLRDELARKQTTDKVLMAPRKAQQ